MASGYQNRGALISESLFPIYLQVLKFVALLFVVFYLLWIAVGASGAVAACPNISGATLANVCLLSLVGMTVTFHVWGRHLERSDSFRKWNPRSLPPEPPDDSSVSLTESLVALVMIVGWFALLSWAGHLATLAGYERSALYSWDALTFGAGYRGAALLLWLKIHAIGSFAISATFLFSPYWSRTKRIFSAAGCYLFALIFAMAGMGVSRAIGFCGETELCGPFDDNFERWSEINLAIFTAVAFALGTYNVYRAYKIGNPKIAHIP